MKIKTAVLWIIVCIVFMLFGGCRYRIFVDDVYDEAIVPPPTIEIPVDDVTETVAEPEDILNVQNDPAMPYEMDEDDTEDKHDENEDTEDEMLENISDDVVIDAVGTISAPFTVEVITDDVRRYGTDASEVSNDVNIIGIGADDEDIDDVLSAEQPSDIEGDAVIGDTGGVLGLMSTYSAILRQGVNSMYPCQLLYVFCETSDDLVTVLRGSERYQLIVASGGMNVSTRLSTDRLQVAADWVVRRNPDAIVKFVDDFILGTSVYNTLAASEQAALMRARPYWGSINAVRSHRMLLLSNDMLAFEETRLAAQLLIAHMLYPELFEHVDVDAAVMGLLAYFSGILFYRA